MIPLTNQGSQWGRTVRSLQFTQQRDAKCYPYGSKWNIWNHRAKMQRFKLDESCFDLLCIWQHFFRFRVKPARGPTATIARWCWKMCDCHTVDGCKILHQLRVRWNPHPTFYRVSSIKGGAGFRNHPQYAGWWFQPIWTILVGIMTFPRYGKHDKCSSHHPPVYIYIYIHTYH